MTITCDGCGVELPEEDAVAEELEDGEILYFCTEECRETAVLLDEEDADVPEVSA